MKFERIKTPGIAHVAYMFGEGDAGVVVDPRRDVSEYLRVARENGLTIRYVLETHRQEDFVLGSGELERVCGAEIVTGDHELFGTASRRLSDGDELEAGPLRIRALHTPGHTPESTSYAVFLKENPEHAWGVFTGDALFVGEAGRTDLPDPARTAENAGLLYDSIHSKLGPLGDQTLLFPAHGAGSVCGGNIADRDQSTLGLERFSNPAFTMDRDSFMRHKVHERIPRPPYFSLMEKVNLQGGLPLDHVLDAVRLLQPEEFRSRSAEGIVIDARLPEAFAGGHIPKSYSIWLSGLPVFGGWIAGQRTPVYLVLDDASEMERAVLHLARIGVDNVRAVLAGGFEAWRDAGLPVDRIGTLTPADLLTRQSEFHVLDVREVTEFEDEGHIAGAQHVYVGDLQDRAGHVREMAAGKPIAVTCSVGHRASLAASILEREGLPGVHNLLGGMTAWGKLELPIEEGAAP